MEKQDETVETNNIMEEKTLCVLSDSSEIEKVASETTLTTKACQLEHMLFSHLDENRDWKISPAELRQCLEVIGVELSEQELVEILDPYYGGEPLEHDDFVKLAESQGNKEVEGNNYSKDAYFRVFDDVWDRNRRMRNHMPALFWRKVKATASGVHVACGGSFKLPLIGFSTLGAFGITFVFGVVALLVFYLIWRFVWKDTNKR